MFVLKLAGGRSTVVHSELKGLNATALWKPERRVECGDLISARCVWELTCIHRSTRRIVFWARSGDLILVTVHERAKPVTGGRLWITSKTVHLRLSDKKS